MNNQTRFRETQIFLDSGNPADTTIALGSIGFLDGQTTNPSLIAKNPQIQKRVQEKKFTEKELLEKYHNIVMDIKNIIPMGKISAEVYADTHSTVDELLAQAYEIHTWFPDIYVKLPITESGLGAAKILVEKGISVNMTLCFSQEQAAAVHSATKNAVGGHVFVSPFIGRLDDIGLDGCSLIKNIQDMYNRWNSHVGVLGASIRTQDHIDFCFNQKIAAVTIPLNLIQELNKNQKVISSQQNNLEKIPYQELLEQDWFLYSLDHELTEKGLEKFATDWNALCE